MINFKTMKKILSRSFVSRFANASTLAICILTPAIAIPKTASLIIKDSPKEVIDQVWQIIYRDYLDSNGNYNSKEWLSLRSEVLGNKYYESSDAHDAIKGMLLRLDDPYTRFLDPKDFKEMRIDTSGELTGIGIQLSLDEKTKNLIVVSPIEDTPAFKAGIQANDIIISIDNNYTDGMNIDEAVKLIRGKKGSTVRLGIRREDEILNFSLVRDLIEISSVVSRINNTENGLKVGYIRLKQFSASSAKDMRDAIYKLEAEVPSGYILDLRGNPGGLLESSIIIARQWIDDGIIVITKSRDGINDIRKANGTALTQKPLVVLVNEGSASASEILAGAIQENKRGILVGKKTFGKGLVQSVRPLVDGSGLTVTVAKYLTPNGTDINKFGIKPNFEATLELNKRKRITLYDLGTNNDSQYIIAEKLLLRDINKPLNNIISFTKNYNFIYEL